jgi:hypothetical protein
MSIKNKIEILRTEIQKFNTEENTLI